MEINSLKFGKIKIDGSKIITFRDPIIGFDNISQYVLIEVHEDSPLKWLQSVEEPSPCFLVTDPHLFMPSYAVEVARQDQARVDSEKSEDLGFIVVITIHEKTKTITANLRGPIIINMQKQLAKQIVVQNDSYSTAHSVCLAPAPREGSQERHAPAAK
ncbi:MAG: flagellar assembly protein FliW [Nitrospinota bacterium]